MTQLKAASRISCSQILAADSSDAGQALQIMQKAFGKGKKDRSADQMLYWKTEDYLASLELRDNGTLSFYLQFYKIRVPELKFIANSFGSFKSKLKKAISAAQAELQARSATLQNAEDILGKLR